MLGLGKVLVVGMVVGLLAGGCGGDDDATPPTTRQVSTTVDPFAVPDPIDVAYVERVMAALDHLYGDAAREVARERALTDEFEAIMRSIYADESALEAAREVWLKEAGRNFSNLADRPGDPITSLEEVMVARRDCVIASVTRDLRPLLTSDPGPSPTQEYRVLVPLDRSRDRGSRNVTGWAMALDGFFADRPVTEAACSVD